MKINTLLKSSRDCIKIIKAKAKDKLSSEQQKEVKKFLITMGLFLIKIISEWEEGRRKIY